MIASSGLLYLSDSALNLGILKMPAEVDGKTDMRKAYGFNGVGLMPDEVEVAGVVLRRDKLASMGVFLGMYRSASTIIEEMQDTNPEVARQLGIELYNILSDASPGELMGNIGRVLGMLPPYGGHIEGHTNSGQIKAFIGKNMEKFYPFSSRVKNWKQAESGGKLSRVGPKEVMPSETIDNMESFLKVVLAAQDSAFGNTGVPHRNAMGSRTHVGVVSDAFSGDNMHVNQVLHYLSTGMRAAGDTEYLDGLLSLGILRAAGAKTDTGGKMETDAMSFTPLSRTLSVPIRRVYDREAMRTNKSHPINLSPQNYNIMLGLLGNDKGTWDDMVEHVSRENKDLATQNRRYLDELGKVHGGKAGESLETTLRRIVLWPYSKRHKSPGTLRSWYETARGTPNILPVEIDMHTRGLTDDERKFNLAKRRAFITIYDLAKRYSSNTMRLFPGLQDRSEELEKILNERK